MLGEMCALTWARRSVAVVEEVDASVGVDGGALSPAMMTSVFGSKRINQGPLRRSDGVAHIATSSVRVRR